MKVFLDTNVLIDYLDRDRPGVRVAEKVLLFCEKEGNQGFISALSIPNILYILRKKVHARAEQNYVVRALCHICQIVPLERGDLLMATGEDFVDYEDGLQCLAAEKMGVDYIVTNDKWGFRGAKVKVVTPREFLAVYGEGASLGHRRA